MVVDCNIPWRGEYEKGSAQDEEGEVKGMHPVTQIFNGARRASAALSAKVMDVDDWYNELVRCAGWGGDWGEEMMTNTKSKRPYPADLSNLLAPNTERDLMHIRGNMVDQIGETECTQ